MRVIRTEVYFDARNIEWPFAEEIFGNPGISFALFKCEVENLDPSDLPVYSNLENGRRVDTDVILRFFDLALRNNTEHFYFRTLSNSGPYPNQKLAQSLLETRIIIENSPPEDVSFTSVLKGASYVTVGSYIGLQAAAGHPLLFLTIPAGIIVVGAAVAVSKAIDSGLNKAIERATKRPKPKK